jgi:hypothetical protein
MKRIILCLALFILAAPALALAQGKFIADYKGMVFGKDLSEFQHMKQVRKQGDLEFYNRYGDERTFQGVPLKEQLYGFYKGKLCLVMFTASGPSSYNTLKTYFDSNYGPASQPKVNIKQFTYTAGEVTVEMEYDDTNKVMSVSYVFKPIMRMMTPVGK